MGRHMIIAVMAMVAMVVISAADATKAAKYSTPAEVLAGDEKAHDAGDDAASVDCLSPEGQQQCLHFLLAMEVATRQPGQGASPLSPEEKKARSEMDALLAKHGIKDLANRPDEDVKTFVERITAHVIDRRTLLIELMRLGNAPGAKPSPCRKGELRDLTIAGDSATGNYVIKEPDGSQSSQYLKFREVDGSWLLADVPMLAIADAPDPADRALTRPAKP